MKKELFIGVFALLAIVGLACGGSASAVTPTPRVTTPPVQPTTPPPPPPEPACEEPTLEISVNGDAFEFDKDRLEAAAGAEVVPCFNNVSSVNQHNWVLVKDGTKDQVADRGLEAGPEYGWLQPGDPDVIANVKLLGPGESGEVRFAAPSAGSYEFVCTFPGHNFTMFGDFVVALAEPGAGPGPGTGPGTGTEDQGVQLIKHTPEYKSLVDKHGPDHVSIQAVNLEDEDEAEFLRKISDGFLVEPGCIIVLKADQGEGYVYQLDEEIQIVSRMTLSQFEQGAHNVDARTMEIFYGSLK